MNKKLKNLKRRWRKIGKPNRTFYRGMTIIAGINILLIPVISNAATNVMWILFIMIMYSTEFVRRRRTQYEWYRKGRRRQIDLDKVKLAKADGIKYLYDRLHSDYRKLEYDYHQLKKSFCDIQNKKTINPKTKKKK